MTRPARRDTSFVPHRGDPLVQIVIAGPVRRVEARMVRALIPETASFEFSGALQTVGSYSGLRTVSTK